MAVTRTWAAAMLTLGRVMALLAGLAMAAVLSRLLDMAEYGAFRQVLMLYAMGLIVFRVGVPQAVFYYLPRTHGAVQKGLIYQSLASLMVQGGLVAAVLYFGADIFGLAWNSKHLPQMLRAFAPYPMLMLPMLAAENVLVHFGRVKTMVILNVLTKTISLFVVVIPVYLGYSTVVAIRLWVLWAALSLVVNILFANRSLSSERVRFTWEMFREQHVYMVPYMVAALLGSLGFYADKIIISSLGSTEQFAVYANGAFELPLIGVINSAVSMAMLPAMVQFAKEGNSEEFLGLWRRSQKKVSVVLYAMFGYFLFFAPEAVELLFGRAYSESTNIFRVYLLLAPIRICAFSSIMVPLRKNWQYAGVHLVQVLIAYPLCYFLYRWAGIEGCALGLAVAVYGTIACMGKVTAKAVHVPLRRVWPFEHLAKTLVVTLMSGTVSFVACVWLEGETSFQQGLRMVLGGVVFIVSYWLLMSRMGLFDWREWRKGLFGKPAASIPPGSPFHVGDADSRLSAPDPIGDKLSERNPKI